MRTGNVADSVRRMGFEEELEGDQEDIASWRISVLS